MNLELITRMMYNTQQQQILLPKGVSIRGPAGDHYTVEGLLGRGRIGVVYLVRDRCIKDNHNLFALKEVIDPNKRDRERFVFEGDILKRLNHRALPRVYRVFEHNKLRRVYMLMDYVEGKNLETLRQEQPEQRFSLPLVLTLMAPIVDALIYLHHQDPPIVHRDIKPANIIVPIGAAEAMLVDFGSADAPRSRKRDLLISIYLTLLLTIALGMGFLSHTWWFTVLLLLCVGALLLSLRRW